MSQKRLKGSITVVMEKSGNKIKTIWNTVKWVTGKANRCPLFL
jgi:hypothetical protein